MQAYANQVELSILWDNTPNATNDWSELLRLLPDTKVISEGENIGLAKAYNRGIEMALQYGCTHFMTMDQDSLFHNFSVFREQSARFVDKYGITCPPINVSDVLLGYNKVVPYAAQSGSIFSLEMIKKIGLFREDLFIGMVDAEMQLKAQENGFSILQIGGCSLSHQVGSGRCVTIFGLRFQVSDYGPLRHYYDSRNRLLLWKEFPYDYDFKGKVKHFKGRFLLCVKILLVEDDKFAKIFAIIRGTINGLLNKSIPF